jgi:hypothetical protein
MLAKCRIDEAGDTNLLPGSLYDPSEVIVANAELKEDQVKYVIYETNVSGIPNIYIPNNTTELIAFVVSRGGTAANEAAALQWIAGQSNLFIISYDYPNIVTNGLTFLLDAKSVESYPTTGSIWRDLSGQNRSGSLTNGPIFNSRGYFNFDGTDDYVAIPNELALTLNGNPGASLEMVLLLKKRDNSSGQSGLTQLSGFNNTNGNLYFYANFGDGTGGLFLDVFRNSRVTIPTSSLSSKTVNPLQWHQLNITTTPGANGWKVYWNGELKYSDTGLSQVFVSSSTYTPSFSSSIGDLTFGKSSGTRELSGSIASYKLYPRTLSQSEILQNYYGGSIVTDGLVFATDASNLISYESGSLTTYSLTGSFSGSLTNGTSYSSNNGGIFVFDGTNDYINVSTPQLLNPGTGSMTVESWFRTNQNATYNGLIEARGTSLYGFLFISDYPSAGKLSLFVNDNVTVSQNSYATTNNPITSSVWNHAVATLNKSTNQVIFYVNGTQAGTPLSLTETGSIDPGSGYVYWIGGDKGGSEMNGNIAITRQYNRVLSAQEVAQNFTAQQNRFI